MAKTLELRDYSFERGLAYRKAMEKLGDEAHPPEWVAADGLAMRDAILNVMHSAELLAGFAGVVPMIKIKRADGNDEFAITQIGEGRAVINDPRKWSSPGKTVTGQTLSARQQQAVVSAYMAVQQAARQATAGVSRGRGNAPELKPPDDVGGLSGFIVNANNTAQVFLSSVGVQLPATPVIAWPVVVIIVVAIAAVVGGAWYASVQKAEIESNRAIQLAKIGKLTDLATQQIASGQEPSDSIVDALGLASSYERGSSWAMPIAGAVLGLGILGVVLVSFQEAMPKKGRRRRAAA